MSKDVVIRAEGLGKKYVIGHETQRERYLALRDVLPQVARNAWRRTADLCSGRAIVSGDTTEEFWALRDVSFEVERGEVLGIIGRNGAGKSTLLKILSRITDPSEGRVMIEGRVASLLEVGTGFHPELTGRENIYLNGAILGMSRGEIRRKFDEIVDFAEIETFLDTPVKRYSSGMYVRLAFAVAAHMEPEIIVVDEVLAVGDVEFQNKCLGRMSEVSNGGRTVLFVSHDMRKVTALCSRGILLNRGRIECDGNISMVADSYSHKHVNTGSYSDLSQRDDRAGSGDARFQSIQLLKNGEPCRTFILGEGCTIKFGIKVRRRTGSKIIKALLITADGIRVQEFCHVWNPVVGNYTLEINVPNLWLYPGTYSVDLWSGDMVQYDVDHVTNAVTFSIIQTAESVVTHPLDRRNGLVFQSADWHCKQVTAHADAPNLAC